MSSKLNPYISFKGNAREAVEFYKTVFGGEFTLSTYKDGGMSHEPSEADKVMHAELIADNGMTLMVSDAPDTGGMPYQKGTNISISLSGDDEAELSGYFDELAIGGNIVEPLAKAPWGDSFGMVVDKFEIFWMVNIAGKAQK